MTGCSSACPLWDGPDLVATTAAKLSGTGAASFDSGHGVGLPGSCSACGGESERDSCFAASASAAAAAAGSSACSRALRPCGEGGVSVTPSSVTRPPQRFPQLLWGRRNGGSQNAPAAPGPDPGRASSGGTPLRRRCPGIAPGDGQGRCPRVAWAADAARAHASPSHGWGVISVWPNAQSAPVGLSAFVCPSTGLLRRASATRLLRSLVWAATRRACQRGGPSPSGLSAEVRDEGERCVRGRHQNAGTQGRAGRRPACCAGGRPSRQAASPVPAQCFPGSSPLSV